VLFTIPQLKQLLNR
jgi:alanyl-tRNA synthetase